MAVFWLPMDMFLQTKIAVIVATTRYVFWAVGMAKMLLQLGYLTTLPRPPSCFLLLYLNITGLLQGPGKMLLGSRKVVQFFVTKSVGTILSRRFIFRSI